MLEDYDILSAASRIVAGREAEHSYQSTLEETLRAFLMMRMGDEWQYSSIMSNLLPGGREIYTAVLVETISTGGSISVQDHRWAWQPQRVLRCVVVARDEFGQFQIAPWSPVGGYE